MENFVASPERLIIGALLGFAVLLFMIIKLKVQPFLSIMLSALIIGLAVGMPFTMITDTLSEGVGTTLQTIAVLIGLGSMFGAILQVSGGVEVIAQTLLDKFGEKKAAWALGVTGLIVGMPVFFESGLLILIPIAFGIAKKTNRSIFHYAIPLLAGLAIGHAFIPPTPGPVLVAEMLNVELSYVIILGIIIGIPAMILAGPVFGKFAGDRYNFPVPSSFEQNEKKMVEGKLPSFGHRGGHYTASAVSDHSEYPVIRDSVYEAAESGTDLFGNPCDRPSAVHDHGPWCCWECATATPGRS